MPKKAILIVMMVALSLFSVGCGRNPKLTGKVFYSDDNSPVTQGTVIFLSNDYTGRGEIGKNGSYSVYSEKDGTGIPPGTYKVYLDGTDKASVSGGGVKLEPLVDRKYTKPDTSGLTITVSKSQVYDLPVERPQ